MSGRQDAMSSQTPPGFKQVAFEYGQIHVRGVFLSKSVPVVSKIVSYDPAAHGQPAVAGSQQSTKTFVKMSSNEPWLVMATTGQRKSNQSSFGRTSLLQVLREKVGEAADGALQSVPDDADVDPMDDIDVPSGPSPEKRQRTRGNGDSRRRFGKNHAKSKIFFTEMPTLTPEEDPEGTAKRTIALYIQDRLTVWLDLENVQWAIRYLFVQNHLKGVPLVSPDSTGPGSKSSSGEL